MSGRGTVVALRALGLGDLLTAVPALRALAAAFPGSRRLLATPPSLAPLARAAADLDGVVPARDLGTPLHCRHPDVAVNLHGRGPESHRLLLATGPGRLLAFRHPQIPETVSAPLWREEEHEVSRWCRLLRAYGIDADPADLLLDPDRLPAIPLAPGTTLLHPGAKAVSRRWPPDRWSEVARAEVRRGCPVVITCGPGEEALAEEVRRGAALLPRCVRRPPNVLDLAGTVAAAARVVCGDTGVAHLATALDRPSVLLFGPSAPDRWGPPPGRNHVVLWTGRTGDPLADVPDAGLLAITCDEVVGALDRLAETSGGAA